MATNPLIEIRNNRLRKVASLRDLGVNPYPSRSRRTRYSRAILDDYAGHEGRDVTVAGRLVSWRKQGALAFGHIEDQTGRIQLFVRRQLLQPTQPAEGQVGYADLGLLDLGDLVEADGKVTKTQRGEISVLVERLRFLTKSIRPLPDQWHGLKDRELILRKRYLDTILDRTCFERFAAISRMVTAIREFLNGRGFLEFQTPVIQPQYGGGTAKPFKTHVNALGCDMYLAISHELYLKRLIVAGYDKVYTIGRYFRNEGIDRSHHPEFSMVETMTAYENYEYNMALIEEMFRHVAVCAFGRTKFKVRGHGIDFSSPWRRVSMGEAVREKTGVDFRSIADVDQANAALARLGLNEPQPSVGEAMVAAFEAAVAPELIQPTLVFGHPIEISPLAKPMSEDPRFAERFEIFIAGMECGDNWSEQNDPIRLLETWRRAYRADERDTGKFHTLDFDFIEALEYGLPPTTGIGPGIERMAMIFTEQENIDDVIFFPMLRPVISPVNASVYGVEETPPSPIEDVALSFEEFEALTADGLLPPYASHITVRPHARVWGANSGAVQVSSFIEIDGVVADGVLRLTGSQIRLESLPKAKDELRARLEEAQQPAVEALRKAFAACHLTVAPLTLAGVAT